MLCDRKGRVVYTVHHFPDPGDENWKKLRAAIDRVLSSPVEHRALKRDGTIYMPATLQRSGESQSDRLNERFASMTCAPDGKNKWHNVPRHGSRGKKVCLRRFEHNAWSEELEISPTDAPQHEKHFDPAIWPCENGVIVAWSWDFHPPNKGYSVFAESPTIFIRPVDDNMGMGRITSVSGKNIDLAPAIGVSRNHQVWSAWDSQSGNRKKQICIASPAIGSDLAPDQIQALDGNMKNVCTPAFVQRPDGGLALLWSETKDGKQWMLRETEFDAVKNQWSQPQVVQSQGNPRFASGAYDKQGHLWVAYSAETERGREIFATKAGNLSHP